jgi:tetratricopeptide (TPR) repeat protein
MVKYIHDFTLHKARRGLGCLTLLAFYAVSAGSLGHITQALGAGAEPITNPAASSSESKGDKPSYDTQDLLPQLQKPYSLFDTGLPKEFHLDPMFLEFPELFSAPEIDTGSVEDYRNEKLDEYQNMYESGILMRKAEEYEGARDYFIKLILASPPTEFRKKSLLQLALIAEKRNNLPRAHTIYNHFDTLYPDDNNLALIYLKQGELLSQMGAVESALQKYHLVISKTMKMQELQGRYQPVIQRLTVKAKVAIADTHFKRGDYKQAARLYRRLLVQKHSNSKLVGINRPVVHYKLIHAHYLDQNHLMVETVGEEFLKNHSDHPMSIEVRYLLAKTFISNQRNPDALKHLHDILKEPAQMDKISPQDQVHVKLRVGKEIAQLMANQGDSLSAIQIHLGLLQLDLKKEGRMETLYQLGNLHEERKQPEKALDFYQQIIDVVSDPKDKETIELIIEMAQWRADTLKQL